MSHLWIWPADEHVDPNKEATAAQVRFGTLTTWLAMDGTRTASNGKRA